MQDEAMLTRLIGRSRQEGDCLVWTGARTGAGYGSIKIGGRQGSAQPVHRVAWIARHGLPPEETPWVLHKCDNPPCFRDEHLFLGTPADNSADMIRKGRQKFFGGSRPQYRCEDGPGAKLTNLKVVEIKWRLLNGESQRSIAKLYDVSQVAISKINRNRSYVEIPWPKV